jgi:hypothetical protein
VSVENARLSIIILTEDSGKDGRSTVEAIARRMLRLVVPDFASHRVQFVPRDPQEEEAMRGNVWKTDGKNPREHERQVRLRRYIARNLCLQNTFVLFHIDGDRIWSDREASENTAKFERLIRSKLAQVIDRARASVARGRPPAESDANPPPPTLRLEHLLLLCPFRSIEAWLYQNLNAATDICNREHRGSHVAELQTWEQRRPELDELPAPEKALCLGKAFNLELATRGFPEREAYDVQKSFAASVDRLLGCEALSRALELTRS